VRAASALAVLVLTSFGSIPSGEAQPADAPGAATGSFRVSKTDFRAFTWGAPPTEVLEREDASPLEDRQNGLKTLVFEGAFRGYPCRIRYQFVDDRLAAGSCVIKGNALPQDVLRCFEDVSAYLTDQYGPPLKDEVLWSSAERRARVPNLKDALWFGYARRQARWERPPTWVTLVLDSPGGPANVTLSITYESLLLKPLADHVRSRARH